MKKIREKINRMSISSKLICSGYLIMTPILLIISILLGINNYKTSEQEKREQALQSTQNVGDSIQLMQNEMEDICIYVSINEDITRIFTTNNIYAMNMDSQLWIHRAPMSMIQNMIALKSYIKTIAIYPENGVNPYLSGLDASVHVSSIEEVRELDIYEKAIEKKGKMGWYIIGKYEGTLYKNNRNDKIVLYREIYDLSKNNRLGFFVMGADKEYFEKHCWNAIDSDKESVIVLDTDGTVLLKAGNIPEEARKYVRSKEYLANGKEFCQYEGYDIYSSRNERNGIVVCKIQPRPSLRESIFKVLGEPAILLFAFGAGLFPILLFISRVVTKPLEQLDNAMDQFKKGDFHQKLEVTTRDEVGQVIECFNEMVDEIRELINKNYIMALKEKESELTALQAQINPHFLYNTLDALYWQVQNTGNEEIAEDILALSNLFRLVLGQGKGITSVGEEVQLITEYLHVQKMRFSQKLEYSINVEEKIKDVVIPKLVLQPFVENAIVHGFEKKKEGCQIIITGKQEGEYLIFTVEDTGAGMNKEQVKGIFEEDKQKRYSGQRVGRYAVKNVKERLTLKYHEDFDLKIESEVGKGTKVVIRIPYEKEEV